MQPVLELIARVGPSDANVLITGENGTGKGTVAQAMHAVSPRAGKPLVTVNAGGLSEGVFESELFGHVKGAFTDAQGRPRRALRAGRRRHAVPRRDRQHLAGPAGEAAARARDRRVRARRLVAHAPRQRAHPLGHQRRPPRRRWRRAASGRTCSSASTRSRSRCRRCATAARTSRCSRAHFLLQHAQRYRKRLSGVRPGAPCSCCCDHAWPGNVRELDHAVERAVLMAQGDTHRRRATSGLRAVARRRAGSSRT